MTDDFKVARDEYNMTDHCIAFSRRVRFGSSILVDKHQHRKMGTKY
jgi:hypothetical protein